MSTTQNDLLKLQNTTEETQQNNNNSPSELVEREKVEGTGFEIIGNKEKGYFVALGIFRITEPKPSKGILRKMIQHKDYEIILGLISASIAMTTKEIKEDLQQKIQLEHKILTNQI